MDFKEAHAFIEECITNPKVRVIDPRSGLPCRIIKVERSAVTEDIDIHFLPPRPITRQQIAQASAEDEPMKPSLRDA